MACVIISEQLGEFLFQRRIQFNELLGEANMNFHFVPAPQGWASLLDEHNLIVNENSNAKHIAPDEACWVGLIHHFELQDNFEVAQIAIGHAQVTIFAMEGTMQHTMTGFPNRMFVNVACLQVILNYHNALIPAESDDSGMSSGSDIDQDGSDPDQNDSDPDQDEFDPDQDDALNDDQGFVEAVEVQPEAVVVQPIALQALQTPYRYIVIRHIVFGTFLLHFIDHLNATLQLHELDLALILTRAPQGWNPEHQVDLYNPLNLPPNSDCWIGRIQHANDQGLVDFVSGWIYLMDQITRNFTFIFLANPSLNNTYEIMMNEYFANLQGQNQNQ